MKKIIFLFTLVFLILTGCFNSNSENNIKLEKGLSAIKGKNEIEILTNKKHLATQIEIKGDIEKDDIFVSNEFLSIIEKNNDVITINVSNLNSIDNNIKFKLLRDNFDNINIKIVRIVTLEDVFVEDNIKKNLNNILLGDYDENGIVDLNDFSIFTENFNKKNSIYDIAPSSKGTNKWGEIYCNLAGDGFIGIEDLVVFAHNFGKIKPIDDLNIEVKDINIVIDKQTLKIGDTLNVYGNVIPENAANKKIIWTTNNNNISITNINDTTISITANNVGTTVLTATSVNGKLKTINIIIAEEETKQDLIIYIESTTAPRLYAWTGSGASEVKLLGAWPGKDLTEQEGKFYYYNFGSEIKSLNYIHFIGGQSADLTTSESIWITSDKKIHKANPYEPSKPIITVGLVDGKYNGDTSISVEITAINNTVDTVNILFNGKIIPYSNTEASFKISDYINDGDSGLLEITASNSQGTVTKVVSIERDDTISSLKLYLEKNQVVYGWTVVNGEVITVNGGWPGKQLDKTIVTNGKTWYVLDFGFVDSGSYILNGQGGTDQSISQTTWVDATGGKYNVDPYEPTKPEISITPGSGTYSDKNGKRKIVISVTVRNATIDSKSATITVDGTSKPITLTGEKTELIFSEVITNNSTATIKVTASNSLGTSEKTVEIKRDDEYTVPRGEFTWENALVYFVLTDRFYNGNPSNDNSYGRKNKIGADPLDIATFHGGDVAGLTEKIEEGYFDELGVNAIWVTALYEQIHGWVGGGSGDFPHYAYHGYYGLDWTAADKNMGTVDEIRKFVDTAHEHGIRVIMDIVVNHVGYNSAMDMVDYGFASYDKAVITDRDWMHPLSPTGWQSHHETVVYYEADQTSTGKNPTPITDWLNWWGPDWVRAGIAGYDAGDGSEIESPLAGLPDIRTEVTTPVNIAPILKTKWGREVTGFEDWIVPAAKKYRDPNSKIAPADYIIKSLAAWVEEFGIDGFRCDTVKHVELFRWKQLKEEANAALKKWRQNNPNSVGSKWTEDFYMFGEFWDFKLGWDKGMYENGFDAMIDFGFPIKNGSGDLGGTWQAYSEATNKVIPYLNSHDMGSVGFFGKGASCIPAGTALVLNPGPVQIYYGDENDRPRGPKCSDPDHEVRSDYVWGANEDKLSHWQKVGKFRSMNPAVGAGTQTEIATDTFLREWKDNKVIIKINVNGKNSVDVGTAFKDGTNLRNAYNGETAKVINGKVEFTGENNIILIELVK